MPHRMDVELTSDRGDGTWTWRAAGARKPRGVLDAALLPEGSKAGDVVRVEADMGVDGISIVSVLPAKERSRRGVKRLEVIGTSDERPAAERSSREPAKGPVQDKADRAGRADGADKERRRGRSRDDRAGAMRGPDDRRPERERMASTARVGGPRRPGPRKEPEAEGPRPKRWSAGHAHRKAALAETPPEQRPVAEQVLRGGIPAVRRAVEAQNVELRARGEPEVKADALVAMAEQLLPRLKAAEWRDRAEAAGKAPDEVPLRELRLVVSGADAAARDDETRLLASTLRQALERRLREQRQGWLDEITAALDAGRVVKALRASARPPDPGARFPAEMAMRLSEAAGQAMSPDAPPDRWAVLLAAVADSPVRRSVKPAGLPQKVDEELLSSARQLSGRVPAVAGLLGIDMPPPPTPPRPAPHARPPRPRQRQKAEATTIEGSGGS